MSRKGSCNLRYTCLIITAGILSGCGGVASAAGEGDAAPDWSLHSLTGVDVAFPEAANGKPSIILFWATWCPYCKALMPYLEEIRRNNEQHDVQVFAINIKEDGDPAAFANQNDFEFVYLLDGEAVAERYAVRFTPGLFVVDKNGTIVFRRKSTELPPGRQVAEFWAERVTTSLNGLINDSKQTFQ